MLVIKIVLWILITLLALIFLLLILPINVELYYNGDKFDFKIKVMFFRVDTLEKWFSKKKNKNPEKERKKEKASKKLKDIQSVAKYVKAFITNSGKIMKMILKSMVFKGLYFKILVGSEEASKTATTYGAVCTAVYPAFSALIACNEPKNYSISVNPDFLSDKIRIFVDLKLKTRLINFLIIAIKSFKIINSNLK